MEEMARLRDYLREQFPTKTELREHYATKADLKDIEIRLMRWMAAMALGGISIAVGLTAVLVRVLACCSQTANQYKGGESCLK